MTEMACLMPIICDDDAVIITPPTIPMAPWSKPLKGGYNNKQPSPTAKLD